MMRNMVGQGDGAPVSGKMALGPIRSLSEFIDMLRRRARLIVQVIAAGCLISVLYALSQQQMYASTEVIQITRPQVADDLVSPVGVVASAHRLQLVHQQVTTRGSLLEIIDGFGLYAEFPDLKPGEMVDRLRQSVRVDGIAGAVDGDGAVDGAMSVLSVTAEMPIARQAQLVAHEFSRRLIDMNASARIDQARETLGFFTAEDGRLAAERAALQGQIAAIDETPLDIGRVGGIERQLRQVQAELAVVSTRRAEAEIGFRLETEGQAERLTVIEPAALSDDPVTGSRMRMAMLGGGLSVILALALAFVQDLRRPVIRSARQMEREIGIVPVISIPFLDATPLRPSRWQRLRAWFDNPTRPGNSTT